MAKALRLASELRLLLILLIRMEVYRKLELENGTVFSVVNKEIQKIDIKYLSDEEYAEIKEILAAWKKDINSK